MTRGEPILSSSDRILILTPAANSHRRDFDFVFKPESEKLRRSYEDTGAVCRVVRVPVAAVDPNTLRVLSGQRAFEAAARAVIDATAEGTPWTHLIVLCHGWRTGIQLGFRTRQRRRNDARNFEDWLDVLRVLPMKTITLFACSAGKEPVTRKNSPGTGDESFADVLRDSTGITVIAHTTVGHATRNPNLITFERSEAPLIGGIRLALPGTALFRNARALLTNIRRGKQRVATGDLPPEGHTRPAFASIPLCTTAVELQAVLSAKPGSMNVS